MRDFYRFSFSQSARDDSPHIGSASFPTIPVAHRCQCSPDTLRLHSSCAGVPSLLASPRLFRRLVDWLRSPAAPRPESAVCESCPLAACIPGTQATVLCVLCHALDVQRLSTLGVFQGALVRVVDARQGVVLDVRGSRLALGHAVVSGITVRPLRP